MCCITGLEKQIKTKQTVFSHDAAILFAIKTILFAGRLLRRGTQASSHLKALVTVV